MPEPQFDPGAVQAVPYEPEFDPSSIVAVPFEPTVGGFDPSSVKAEPYLGPRGGFFNELFLGTKAGEPQTRRLLAGYLEKELTKYGLNYAVPSLANWARNVQEASAKEAAKYTPRVADFQDIHNGRDFLDWLGFAVGENAVNLGLATVAADITGAFGAGFGGVPGAAAGAAIGAAFISKILNEGEFYANLVAADVDKHRALAAADTTGQLAAALDAVVPYKTAYGTFWKPAKKIGKGVARSAARAAGRKIVGTVAGVAKGAAAGFLEEGATEVGQDILQMASKSALVDKYSMMTPESAAQLFNTFMAAGFTGAGFRGGGSLIEQMRGPEPSIGFSNPRTGRNKPPPQVLDLVVQAEGPQTEWVPRREALEGAPAVVREEIPIKGLLEAPKAVVEPVMTTPATQTQPTLVDVNLKFPIPAATQESLLKMANDPVIAEFSKNAGVRGIVIDAPYMYELSQEGGVTPSGEVRLNPNVTNIRKTYLHELGEIIYARSSEEQRKLLEGEARKNIKVLEKEAPGYVQLMQSGVKNEAVAETFGLYDSLPLESKAILRSLSPERPFAEVFREEMGVSTTGVVEGKVVPWEEIPLGEITDEYDLAGIVEAYGDKMVSMKDVNGGRHRMPASMMARALQNPLVEGHVRSLIVRPGELTPPKLDAHTLQYLPNLKAGFEESGIVEGAPASALAAEVEAVTAPSPREQEYPPDVTALTDVVMKGVTKLEKQHPPTEPPEPPPPAPSSVGFAKEQGPPSVQNELDQFGLFEKWAMTPLQNAEANQHIPGVRNYMGRVEQWTGESTIQTRKGDVLLQNWDLLGVDQANRLGRFLIDTTIASQKAGRRFTPVELLERSQGKDFKLNEQAFTLWQQIDQQFQDWLDEYRKIAFEKIQNSDAHPSIKIAKIAELGKQFARLKSFHYFPIMRFGKHVLRASDPKTGRTKWMESYRTRRERDKRYAEFAAEFEPQGLKVATDTLTDTQYSLMGFPPGLMDMLETKLDLDADQRKALHDIYLNWLPGKSFLKHMMKRRLVGGFSEDARRAFASYTQSISNFLARMKHGEELLKAVQDVERSYGMLSGPRAHLRREIAADLERHRQYIMNPGSELGAIRSGMFQWFFSYVPKQVVVNFTQIPLLTYPHLAAAAGPVGIGDVKATIAITKAIKDMFYIYDWRHGWRGKLDQYQRLSEKKQAMIARAVDEQFLNEGMFAHVAGYALGNPLTRYLPLPDPIGDPAGRVSKIVRAGLEFGVLPFQTSEDANRRITFVAALDIAEGLGMDDEQAYQFAKNSVRKTQGEYAQWNRPRLMRGKKSAYFIFKTFLQFSLHFGFTAPGRGRFWLMMLAMGGYLGLPGAEDLLDALSGMGNWLKRHFQFKGDPRTDLEEDLATMMRSMRQDPDAWAHGLGRTTFGYGSLGKMWGIPVPQLDFSSSLQMGRVVPGVKPMRNLLEGGDWATNAARFMAEWIGPGGTLGYTMGRSLVDDSPGSIQWMRVFSPRAVAQITNWWEAGHPVPFGSHIGMEWKGGATTNSRGQKIVEYDPNDIEQELEIFGMLMGVASARLARKRDVSWAQSEASNYYNTLREMLFQAASRAKDREAKAAVKRRVDWFNNNAPPGARITNKELIESVRRRGKTEKLREDSLPTQKRWVQLYKDIEEAYSPPSQP